jgi:hypothetical protein
MAIFKLANSSSVLDIIVQHAGRRRGFYTFGVAAIKCSQG